MSAPSAATPPPSTKPGHARRRSSPAAGGAQLRAPVGQPDDLDAQLARATVPSSSRFCSIEARISSGGAGRHQVHRPPSSVGDGLADLLGLVDRHLRRRRADLELAPGEQERATVRTAARRARSRSRARVLSDEHRVEPPGERQQHEDQREHAEHGAGRDRRGAAGDAGRPSAVTSALASSISSRTSGDSRSETSVTAVARFSGCPF